MSKGKQLKRYMVNWSCQEMVEDEFGGFCKVVDVNKRIKELEHSLGFYRSRCEAIQEIQGQLPDPGRQDICDILANGKTFKAAHGRERTQTEKVAMGMKEIESWVTCVGCKEHPDVKLGEAVAEYLNKG